MIKFYVLKFSKKNNLGYPYSYKNILTKYQFYKSFQISMFYKNEWVGIARLHYINEITLELGDFFISENYRGKKYKGKKYYQYLIEKVINEIKKNRKIKIITLAVIKNNISAINIYKKNRFKIFKNISKHKFNKPKTKFIYMKLEM